MGARINPAQGGCSLTFSDSKEAGRQHITIVSATTVKPTEAGSGGSVEPVELTPEYEHAAERSAQIMGLRVAGVYMLDGNDRPFMLEVNSSPGREEIERTRFEPIDSFKELSAQEHTLLTRCDHRGLVVLCN